jgi:hypothetical protein
VEQWLITVQHSDRAKLLAVKRRKPPTGDVIRAAGVRPAGAPLLPFAFVARLSPSYQGARGLATKRAIMARLRRLAETAQNLGVPDLNPVATARDARLLQCAPADLQVTHAQRFIFASKNSRSLWGLLANARRVSKQSTGAAAP